ncbi:hypothetical protein H0H87_000471 [Tephrocybe sp. NHM501043]|nr:hypothetical protein H0H87_000471 [Tephrocybe sp. NHM501043]
MNLPLVTAIANYTTRVVDKKLPADQRQEALKFLTHVSIVMPLHVENLAVGGNTISVTCGGNTTNLHALWGEGIACKELVYELMSFDSTDTSLVDKLVASEYENSVTHWAHSLASDIKVPA